MWDKAQLGKTGMTSIDEDDKKQIKEHIRTLEYVRDELVMQHDALSERILNLNVRIIQEKNKLKHAN